CYFVRFYVQLSFSKVFSSCTSSWHKTSLTSHKMFSPPKYLLIITSHGRTFGPLTPTPNILINLMSLPNPPVQLRKKYLGTNARLRKEFFGDERARVALEGSLAEVKEAMEEIERRSRGLRVEKRGRDGVTEMSRLDVKDDRDASGVTGGVSD